MDPATKIAMTADIWTKRDVSESFLGVTAHWLDTKSHQKRMACLTLFESSMALMLLN
jgi:hypothetical protein